MAKNDEDDNLRDDVERMADRLGLKGQRRSKYIHQHMLEAGYKAVPHYVRGDDDDDDDDGGFLGRGDDDGGRERSQRRSSRSRRSSRDDDWY